MITLNFTAAINNDSLQIGDLAYFVTPSAFGGFNQSTNTPTLIGPIVGIDVNPQAPGSIAVDETSGTTPSPNDFIMFAKNTSVNLSGLVGYYAEVKISNNSNEKAELFAISSGITPSSK